MLVQQHSGLICTVIPAPLFRHSRESGNPHLPCYISFFRSHTVIPA